MSPLALFSGPYALLARAVVMLIIAAVLFAYGWVKGNDHGTKKLTDYIGQQAVASQKLLQARVQVVTKIETKYAVITKTIEKQGETITKEIPVHVTNADDARCVLSTGFVRVYDAAVSGNADTGPASEAERAPSGIPLSVLAETDTFNITLGRLWRARAQQCVESYDAVRASKP